MINTKAVIKNFIKHPFKASGKIHKFLSHLRKYNKLNTRKDFHASPNNFYFCLNDWDDQAGSLGVYFYQDLWAAKKIFALKPSEHFDIGSRVDGFIAHVLPFMPLTMIDIRPLPEKVEGLKFIQADATNLEGIADNSIISLSSLCAPEHFGLGRYGDPIDPEACFKALKSMQRVLAKGGHLYIAVPVGEQSGVAFNAHRIFKPELVIETLNELTLAEFSVIISSGKHKGCHERISLEEFHGMDLGIDYGAGTDGLFEFVRE